jgi:drug/metabolite transporter (DMT)-like permease
VCLTLGVRYSTASNGSLLVNSQPIFTTLLAPLIINEDFTPLRLLGALAGIAGVYLVVTGGKALGSILGQQHFTGNLILVGAAVAISLYTILLKRYVIRYGGFLPTFLTMLAGTVLLTPAAFLFTKGRPLAGLQISHLPLLLYIGVVCTALVYPLFNRALRENGVVRAVGFKLLIPVFGIVLSVVLLHERPGLGTVLGAVVVIGAVLLIQTVRAQEPGMVAARRTGRPRRRDAV